MQLSVCERKAGGGSDWYVRLPIATRSINQPLLQTLTDRFTAHTSRIKVCFFFFFHRLKPPFQNLLGILLLLVALSVPREKRLKNLFQIQTILQFPTKEEWNQSHPSRELRARLCKSRCTFQFVKQDEVKRVIYVLVLTYYSNAPHFEVHKHFEFLGW